MKRRSWLWFIASAVLAVLAGVLAIFALNQFGADRTVQASEPKQACRHRPPAPGGQHGHPRRLCERRGAGRVAQRRGGARLGRAGPDYPARYRHRRGHRYAGHHGIRPASAAPGTCPSCLAMTRSPSPCRPTTSSANGALCCPAITWTSCLRSTSSWKRPSIPRTLILTDEGEFLYGLERDQSLDNVSVLTLQNLEVLQILEEPQIQTEEDQRGQEAATTPPSRALVLKIDPQDAVVLKYLRDSVGSIDLALRSAEQQHTVRSPAGKHQLFGVALWHCAAPTLGMTGAINEPLNGANETR